MQGDENCNSTKFHECSSNGLEVIAENLSAELAERNERIFGLGSSCGIDRGHLGLPSCKI